MRQIRIGLHRLMWLMLVPVMLFVIGLYLVLSGTAQPFSLTIDAHGATGTIRSDDLFVSAADGCTTVHWQIDGARMVERDGAGVAAAGSAPQCADTVFDVVFADGETRAYLVPWRPVFAHVAALALASAAVLVGGIWLLVRPPRSAAGTADVGQSIGAARLWALALLVAIVLAAWGLRLGFAVRVPLYIDEAWTYTEFVEPPLHIGLPRFWTTNNHPLNTLLIHIAVRVLGNSELSLRLPALWLGLLSIAAVYQAGRTLYSRQVGVVAAAVSAVWPLMSEYGWQARGYTGMLVCTFVLLTLAARQRRRPTRARWVAYAVVSALGTYFVLTTLYPVVLVSAWLAAQWWIADGLRVVRARRLWTLALVLVGAGLLTLALYTPQIHYLMTTPDRPADPNRAEVFFPVDSYVFTVLIGEWARQWTYAAGGVPLLVALALGGGVAVAWGAGCRPRGLASDPLATLLPLGLLVLLAHRPTFLIRTWLFYLPLVAITAAVGWLWLLDWAARGRRSPRSQWAATGLLSAALVVGWGGWGLTGMNGLPSADDRTLWATTPALAAALAQQRDVQALHVYMCPTLRYYVVRAGGIRYRCGELDETLLLVARYAPGTIPADRRRILDRYDLRERGYRIDAAPLIVIDDATVWRVTRAAAP